jgi:hypothetical protein
MGLVNGSMVWYLLRKLKDVINPAWPKKALVKALSFTSHCHLFVMS